jgi:formylglycine-generating enzyme required for sulfatase activity
VKNAVGGSISAPTGTDVSVSARSQALGDTLTAGQTRNYAVYYRDPVVLGGCMAGGTFNMTQSGAVTWIYSSTPPVPALLAINAGTFQMGSSAASAAPYFGDASTQPVHAVTLTYNFWMGATEVTQAQYQALMGTNPSQFVAPNNPVEKVSWNDAQAYCAALTTQQTALGNVPAGYTFRLPTEAEWEYACRAGTTSEFNGGTGLFCSDARFGYSYHSNSSCGSTGPVSVASYFPNNWGLYDMHGNVREWCLDSYVGYTAGAVTDPYLTGGFAQVTRGGGWDSNSNLARSAYRTGSSTPGNNIGFRVVLGPVLSPTGTGGPTAPAGFVTIQPGTFQMGSNAANAAPYYNDSSTQPVHAVTLSYTYWMGATEVTQAQYQALMGTNPSGFPGANNPVEQVSWNNAVAYCAALTTQQAALGNVPAGYQYRLPTEAEWEYACRAGTTTEFNTGAALFCNDAKFDYSYHSNSSCNYSSSTVPVGSYAPNAWGLYDMHGNVWEWCLDSYASYTAGAVTDPFVTGGPNRVIRGGGWNVNSSFCRSAIRVSSIPGITDLSLGFRVVLAPVLVP